MHLEYRVSSRVFKQLPAAIRSLRRRSGAEEENDREPLDDLSPLEDIIGTPGVLKRTLRRVRAHPYSPCEVVCW